MEPVIFSRLTTSRYNKLDVWHNQNAQNWPRKRLMRTTLQNLTVFAIILKEIYSNSSTIYHPLSFLPKDNRKKYLEILQEKYDFYWRLSFVYKDLSLIKCEGINPHLADN